MCTDTRGTTLHGLGSPCNMDREDFGVDADVHVCTTCLTARHGSRYIPELL